jgi:hypothetical protein
MSITERRAAAFVEMSRQEIDRLPAVEDRCSAGGCCDSLKGYPHGVDRAWKAEGQNKVRFHQRCIPGQTPGQKIRSGLGVTLDGIGKAIVKHPIKAALVGLACVGGIFLGAKLVAATAASFHTYCIADNSKQLWCVTQKVTDSLEGAVFERYETVKHWIHSGDFAQRTYEQLKGGAEVVLDVTKKYFVENPFKKFFG